jgi:hypothetical protein
VNDRVYLGSIYVTKEPRTIHEEVKLEEEVGLMRAGGKLTREIEE